MTATKHDEATERILASFAKQRAKRKEREAGEPTWDYANAQELACFDRAESEAINRTKGG